MLFLAKIAEKLSEVVIQGSDRNPCLDVDWNSKIVPPFYAVHIHFSLRKYPEDWIHSLHKPDEKQWNRLSHKANFQVALEWFSISKTQKDVCDGFEINANHNHRISPQNGGLKSNFASLTSEEYLLQNITQ